MILESGASWYAAYLIYQTGSANAVYSGGDELVFIQEDLILVEAPDADEAYAKVIALGNAVGEFGQHLLEGKTEAFLQLGLNDLGQPLGKEMGNYGELHESPMSHRPWVHPTMKSIYQGMTFLGLKDLVPLRNQPEDRLEIDIRAMTMEPGILANSLIPSKGALLAFSPAGPAFVGTSKSGEEARLYEQYHWYLAEQLYECVRDDWEERFAKSKAVVRLVLIRADSPEKAFRSARDDASEWLRSHESRHFVGLHGLSLVSSKLADGCEIRTLLIELPHCRLIEYVAPHQTFAAFATIQGTANYIDINRDRGNPIKCN